MDSLRQRFLNLFFRNHDENEEPMTRDLMDLVQQQQQQQDYHEDQQQQDEQRSNAIEAWTSSLPEPPANVANRFNVTTADPPAESGPMAMNAFEPMGPGINYQLEFVNFIERNAPQGFAQKLQHMMPFLGVSLVAWPTYWLYRGYQWQSRRRSERIGMYIQRTFQHAKVMQVAIIGLGLLMASSAHSAAAYEVHEVDYKSNQQDDDNK